MKMTLKRIEEINENNELNSFNEREYISNIYECEKEKYILENRLLKLQQTINGKKQIPRFEQTNFYNEFQKSCASLKELPNEPRDFSAEDYVGPLILTGVLFFIISFVLPFVFDIYSFGSVFLVDAIISVIALIVFINIKKSRFEKEYELYVEEKNRVNNANDEIEEYNKKLYAEKEKEYDEYCLELLKRADEYKNSIKPEYDKACDTLKKLRYTLLNLYEYRINGTLCLHPDYRGLIAISVINGYFETGRCTQLRGHEGAYNLYEDEKFKGVIITKLNIVSQQLNRLENSMVYVGQAIEDCNYRLAELETTSNQMINAVNRVNATVSNKLDDISNQNAQIEENVANAAYYSEISANMASINTMYNLLN